MLVDLALARRLEEAEAFTAEAYARTLRRLEPGMDVAVERIAGGRSVFVGVGSPLTETKAVGLRGPVTDADIDRMESVVFPRGDASRIVVCPLSDGSLVEALGRRGYRLCGFETSMAMPLGPAAPDPPLHSDVEARPMDPGERDLYARVVAPNFVDPSGPLDEMTRLMNVMVEMEHASPYLAFIGGEPVGGGSVLIHQGLAILAGAAVLPQHRNRGAHAALLQARLSLARRHGCDLAAQAAQPGSPSERNAIRAGFQIAYTRAFLVRDAIR